MAKYTVFGSSAPSYSMTVSTDRPDPIELANKFYTTSNNGQAIGWRCVGGRVYIPNNPLITNQPITLRLYIGDEHQTPALGGANFIREESTITPAGGGWCEVYWSVPYTIEYGPEACLMVISYHFTDPSAQMYYIYGSGLSLDPVNSVDVGSSLVLSESNGVPLENFRGLYQFVSEGTAQSTTWYSSDVILDGPPAPNTYTPDAKYNFNEGSGTVINDTTGNGHNLTTQSKYFTYNGYADDGLKQTASAEESVSMANGNFTALDFVNNQKFTIMFWGKYTVDNPGPSWTIQQNADNDSSVLNWSISMSNGVNTVWLLRISGAPYNRIVPKTTTNVWHHYAVTGNGRYYRFYIDGVLVDEFYLYGTMGTGGENNLRIFGGLMQNEVIDDLQFFGFDLGPSAIAYQMSLSTASVRSGKITVWDGTAWQGHPIKYWDGVSWNKHNALGYNGTKFIKGKG